MSNNAIQLIGVYDADGTVRGEVSYWVGARFGVRHCSLCDITHGTFREKSEWREKLGIEFLTFHRDDQPDDVREHLNGHYPAVVMRREDGRIEGFMNAEDIEACHASPDTFVAEIRRRLG